MKMDRTIKKNLRLISEKYNHGIAYHDNYLLISGLINKIKISQHKKYNFNVEYNIALQTISVHVEKQDIYDIVLELLRRYELYILKPRPGKLLQIKDWINNECTTNKKEIKQSILSVRNSENEYKYFGGNRLELEYYKGIFILQDDLCIEKSNIIEAHLVLI